MGLKGEGAGEINFERGPSAEADFGIRAARDRHALGGLVEVTEDAGRNGLTRAVAIVSRGADLGNLSLNAVSIDGGRLLDAPDLTVDSVFTPASRCRG